MSVHFSSKSTEWSTPQWLFDKLNAEFDFGLDAAATSENAKCRAYYDKANSGLDNPWSLYSGTAVWLNPPYGRELPRWVGKAAFEARQGATVVALIPARPDTRYWADHIWDHERHHPRPHVEVRFLKGRLTFGGAKHAAPFPSAIVVFHFWSGAVPS